MSADKNPIEDAVEQALDAFLYAPIGLLFDGPARFPKLVRNGRTQVTNARMMGQFAVQMGRSEVEKRVKELETPVTEVLRSVGLVPDAPVPSPTPTVVNESTATSEPAAASGTKTARAAKAGAKKTSTNKAGTTKAGTAKKAATRTKKAAKKVAKKTTGAGSATPTAESLPIPDYDSLSASQVVTRLRGLGDAELDAVRDYETATRGRKTILSRVQQLQKR